MSQTLPAIQQIKQYLSTGEEVQRQLDDNFLHLVFQQNSELSMRFIVDYVQKIQLSGADPRLGQIFLITRNKKVRKGGRDEWTKVGVTVFSYHFFLSRAEQSGMLADIGLKTEVVEYYNPFSGETEKQLAATASVKRTDRETPFTFTAYWKEFYDEKSPIWKSKPHTMLGKCAIANALRIAFPNVLTGMYIEEEINEQVEKEVEIEQFDSDIETTSEMFKNISTAPSEKSARVQRFFDTLERYYHDKTPIERITIYNELTGLSQVDELRKQSIKDIDKYLKSLDAHIEAETSKELEKIKKQMPEHKTAADVSFKLGETNVSEDTKKGQDA